MNQHIEALQKRLKDLFEHKAREFDKYSRDNPNTAPVTQEIAGLYEDLAEVMTGR